MLPHRVQRFLGGLIALAGVAAAQTPKTMSTNHLAGQTSPYLLQHQHNPVDWYPWGEEAFAKARKEGKPIFLSVGYSTCHWCHVMAHESFESEEVAAILNEHFVSIKIDREERPDVDRVYMTFVQATTGSGGWPMSVFLTPELEPFFGGTYFPPDDRYGRPGFKSLLGRIISGWKSDRAGIAAHGRKVVEQLREYQAPEKADGQLGVETLRHGLDVFTRSYDEEWGGFGDAPKFPRPATLDFLFRCAVRFGLESRDGKAALGMALGTLEHMALGGMHDHLGGGFHRYSVDRVWHVPHYEKMLYDQAQLACSYIDASLATRDSRWEAIARGILGYVQRDMTSLEGGFYSAEDADSLLAHGQPEHAEGAFYVWTQEEIHAALEPETASIFDSFYGVEKDGNSPPGSDPHGELKGKNTLYQRLTLAEAAKLISKAEAELASLLQRARQTLFDLRARRPRPHLDDKIITAWNGLMISAFARAARAFDEPSYLSSAQRAAAFLKREMWKEGSLRRSYRQSAGAVEGFAEDYAYLIAGLIDLYQADFDTTHLAWAVELQSRMDALFADEEHGGYYSTTGRDPSVLLRMKEDYDGAEPSPGSIAAHNLLRLSQILGDDSLRRRAERTIAAATRPLTSLPNSLPQMLCALDASLGKGRQIVIAGSPEAADTRALLRATRTTLRPDQLVLLADGAAGQAWLGQRLEFIRTAKPVDGRAAAYVCEDFVCQAPTTDPERIR